MQKEYGWELKKQRLMANKSGKRGVRITVIAVRDKNHNLLAPFRFEGYANKEIFKQYLTRVLLPLIKSKEKIIIMDNASFHKGDDITKLIESSKNKLKYLPTYSPDLNPIEKKWAQIKKIYRKMTHKFENKLELLDCLLNEESYQLFC